MNTIGYVVFLLVNLVGIICGIKGSADEFTRFVDDYWAWRMEQSPEFATKSGSPLYADRWQTLTEDTFTRDKNRAEEFVERIQMLDTSVLSPDDDVTYKVIHSTLSAYVSGYKYRKLTQYNPVSPMGHPFSDWKKIINIMPTRTLTDYDNLIKRYRGIDVQVNEMIALMREAIRLNTTQHSASLVGMEQRVETILADITNKTSFFYKPLYRMPQNFSQEQVLNITRTMTSAIQDFVVPAIIRYGQFVTQEYSLHTRASPGVHSLPGGQELYQECLRWHLDVTLTAREVHDMGLSEVSRIQAQIERLMRNDNFNGTVQDYFTDLKAKPENYYKTEADMLNGYRELILNTRQHLHKVLPDSALAHKCPIIVEQNMNPQGWASYRSPSPDLSVPGAFVINVFNPETRPTFGMAALTLHEAEPGHHTQGCYTLAQGGTRRGRKVAFRKYYAIPFNFPFYTAFSEGWALYAESLGEEMGIYDTSNKLLGRYLNELFRAARLVVDTGIHSMGWSAQQAVDYLANNTARSTEFVENEVNRYITWPGQACSYKIGELKIRELREKAVNKLGSLFDVRYFHNEILTLGNVPMVVLEQRLDRWTQQVLDSHNSGSTHAVLSMSVVIYSILYCMFHGGFVIN